MTDQQANAELLLIAAQLTAGNFCVTADLLVDANGVAKVLGRSKKTIDNWFYLDFGPKPAATVRGRRMYRLVEVIVFRDDPSKFDFAA